VQHHDGAVFIPREIVVHGVGTAFEDEGLPSFTRSAGKMACREQLLSIPESKGLAVTEGEGPWFPAIMSDFDISIELPQEMSSKLDPSEIKMVRQLSERPELSRFTDKIRMKFWCRARGFEIPDIYHFPNIDPVAPFEVLSKPVFVAKPSHLADTSYVYVMRNGIDLVTGNVISVEDILAGLSKAFGLRS